MKSYQSNLLRAWEPHVVRTVLVIALAVGTLACGDDEMESGPRGGDPSLAGPPAADDPHAAGGHGAPAKKAPATARTNERWSGKQTKMPDGKIAQEQGLKDFFLGVANDERRGFVRQVTFRDPFMPMLWKYAKAELEPLAEEETVVKGPIGPAAADPTPPDNPGQVTAGGPTQKYPVQDYRVTLIRWGTSVNKAVVQDPAGDTFVITKDMMLGNRNGVVTSITRDTLRVKEPDRADEIVRDIKEPILAIKQSEGHSERLFTNLSGR